ncbi:MAG: DUF61 family protein [Desulfurococcaceae archaeon]
MSDVLDVFLREELRIVNKHIPRKRVSLCELLEMKIPYVTTHDGTLHVFDPRELELLAKISNRDCSLMLPMIIEYIPEKEGTYVIKNPIEAGIVASILKIEKQTPLFLHRAHVLELRRILRTTSTILLNPGQL